MCLGSLQKERLCILLPFWHLKEMKKHHNAFIVAIARLLLTIIWTLLSKEEKFDNEYHLKKNIPSITSIKVE